jgi:DNA adenine methylase
MEASAMLKKYNVEFQFISFESIFEIAKEGDLLYCDPPYENVKTNSMYLKNSFDSSTLFNELKKLNDRNIKWLLSYDGLELLKSKNIIIPENMYKRHIEIVQSSSSYRNLSNSKTNNNTVKESLFCNFE